MRSHQRGKKSGGVAKQHVGCWVEEEEKEEVRRKTRGDRRKDKEGEEEELTVHSTCFLAVSFSAPSDKWMHKVLSTSFFS